MSPRFHPGRSDFPSPVGDLGHCLRSSLPCGAEAQVLAHIHPLRHRFTPPLDITTMIGFVGSKSLSKIENDIHQAPRAPLLLRGVTSPEATFKIASMGVAPPSLLIRAHVPIPNPPLGLASALPHGLRRLLSAPAGSGTFPALSLQSLCRCSDPYPVAPRWCTLPVTSQQASDSPQWKRVRRARLSLRQLQQGAGISGLQSFTHVRAPTLAWPPGCSHREASRETPGGRAVYTTQHSVGHQYLRQSRRLDL